MSSSTQFVAADSTPAGTPTSASGSALKRRVALSSLLAAAVMTALKLAAGLLSGSLGVLSDAAHSALDLAGAGITFFSVRVSDKPADEDHTYGHAKFENLSSFIEAGLMAISCAWILWEAVQKILSGGSRVQHSLWPVLVLLTSIGVDWWRSRALLHAATQLQSPALATDAFHFASDIWSTLAVLIGLGLGWLGMRYHVAPLRFADPLAAILVSLMILRFTWRLALETAAALLDAAPAEIQSRIRTAVESIPGLLAIEQVRVRRAGSATFADLTLALPRSFTFEHSGELVRAATRAVHSVVPRADVVIHTVPRETPAESIFDRVRAVAARNNVGVHEVSIQSVEEKLRAELHVELNETLTLAAAHSFVTEMEAEILREIPELAAVLTHIESEPATIEKPVILDNAASAQEQSEASRVETALQLTASAFPEVLDVHAILIERSGDHLNLSFHCTMPDTLPMVRVHQIITGLEDRFKIACPEVYKVLIHPEPQTDNLR